MGPITNIFCRGYPATCLSGIKSIQFRGPGPSAPSTPSRSSSFSAYLSPCPTVSLVSACAPTALSPLHTSSRQAAFEVHREARLDVLRLCQQALGGAVGGGAAAGLGGGALSGGGSGSGGGAGSDLALPAVLLLGNLAARHPALLCEHTARLKVRGGG